MIQPIGYFRLWRELYSKPIWLKSSLEQKAILIALLGMANFKPKQWEWNGKKFEVKEGQFITSANSIIECCGGGITRQNVRTALERFKKLDFLTYESTKTGLLITIDNWALYQGNGEQANQLTNHDLTMSQPSPNQDLTTREEGNKEKKVKNDKEKDISVDKPLSHKFTIPTLEEVKAYCNERNNNIDANIFIDFYTSKGWMIGKNKMKDWQSAIRTWERKNKDNPQQQKQQYKQAANDNKRQYQGNDLEKMLLGR